MSSVRSVAKPTHWIALLVMLCAASVNADNMPTVGTDIGELYPDFYLPKLDGTFGRLSDYRGTKVLLIHFASW